MLLKGNKHRIGWGSVILETLVCEIWTWHTSQIRDWQHLHRYSGIRVFDEENSRSRSERWTFFRNAMEVRSYKIRCSNTKNLFRLVLQVIIFSWIICTAVIEKSCDWLSSLAYLGIPNILHLPSLPITQLLVVHNEYSCYWYWYFSYALLIIFSTFLLCDNELENDERTTWAFYRLFK